MSVQKTSAYAAFATLLADCANPVSPAELHGLLVGRCVGGAGFDADPWLADARDLLGQEPEGAVRQALVGLQEMVRGEFGDDDVTLVLLLPGDDEPLRERTEALGQWCQGFLSGFGTTVGGRTLSGEAREVLEDLTAIAQIQGGDADSEDGENDYMEVAEYLRVAPLLLFAECGRAAAGEAPAKPSLH